MLLLRNINLGGDFIKNTNYIITFVALGLTSFILTGCSVEDTDNNNINGEINDNINNAKKIKFHKMPDLPRAQKIKEDSLVEFEKGGKFGLKDSENNIVVKPIYDNIYVGDFFIEVEITDEDDEILYGVLNYKGDVILEPEYESVYISESLIGAYAGDVVKLLDSDGNLLEDYSFDGIESIPDATLNSEGNIYVYLAENAYGLIDFDRRMITEPLFYAVGGLIDDNKIVVQDINTNLFGAIDLDGNWIVDPVFEDINTETSPYKSCYVVKFNNNYGVFDFSNIKWIINPIYHDFEQDDFSENKTSNIMFMKSGKYGVVDMKNNIIIPFEYDNIARDESVDNLFLVGKDNLFGFINSKNESVIEIKYEYCTSFDDVFKLAAFLKDGKVGCVNKKGVEVIKAEYDDIFFTYDDELEADVIGIRKDTTEYLLNDKFKVLKTYEVDGDSLLSDLDDSGAIITESGLSFISYE